MTKVFFGCSMRGGHKKLSRKQLAKFPQIIEELGHKLPSKHQTKKDIIKSEDCLSPEDIHDRDYKWLMESDIGIFEITNGSIGTGEEISDMVWLGKPILCLYKKSLEGEVSAYGRGKQKSKYIESPFKCYAYKSLEDAKNKIKKFIELN